jgi:uncharacterized protein YjbI with pentapeptide repeats
MCHLSDALTLTAAKVDGSDFRDISGDWSSVTFRCASLIGVDFTGSSWYNKVALEGANMSQAKFCGAQNLNFSMDQHTKWTGADFRGIQCGVAQQVQLASLGALF